MQPKAKRSRHWELQFWAHILSRMMLLSAVIKYFYYLLGKANTEKKKQLTHTLLPRILCFFQTLQCGLVHFASQLTFLLSTLYSDRLYSSAHLAPWNPLLPGTLCYLEHYSIEHFISWYTSLLFFVHKLVMFFLICQTYYSYHQAETNAH